MDEKLLYVVALGCPKNRVDVETVVAKAKTRGFGLTGSAEDADVVLVATCGFISAAAEESISTALELSAQRREGARLVVSGCLSQRWGEELAAALPEADFLVGTADLDLIVDAVAGDGPRMAVGTAGSDITTPVGRQPSGHPGSAYVKIGDGCSRSCAFCTIPAIRGEGRSRPIDEICDEARELSQAGVVELNLVAQDLTAYGRDRGSSETLADLLRALDAVDGIRWIRPLYLYPEKRLRSVMRAMVELTKVVPYLDLPIQHASDDVLQRMKRGHRAKLLGTILDDARRLIPGVFLRTTVIVGHPGEGQEDFEELLTFVKKVRFEHLGTFRYSPEDGTASVEQRDVPTRRDSYNRYRKLMSIQRRISRARCKAMIGETVEVLVEGPSEDSPLVWVGRHAGQAPEVDGVVYLDQPAEPGSIVTVTITDSGDYDLVGELQV